MINLTNDIYTHLTSVSALTTMTEGRIWGDSNFPPQSHRPDDGPALTFRPRGGFLDYTTKVWHISYQFKCYGETDHASMSPQQSSYALYEVLCDNINEKSFGSVRYSYVSVPQQAFTENFPTTWPFYLAFVDFLALNPT